MDQTAAPPDPVDWLSKPGLERAHAFKPSGRAVCGHWSADERWLPSQLPRCGNCTRLLPLWQAREAAEQKMERYPQTW
jgi:hypothetical protein